MKTIERQIIKKYEEQVEILRRMKDDSGLGYPPSKFIKDINRSEELDNEISALKSQLKDTEPELKQPDPLLKESGGKLNKPEVKTAEKFVNKKLGDKNYTHSPYTMYREEIVKWLNEFASQFQEQPITVTDEMIEKYAYSVELDQNVSIWEKIVNAAKWALSLKAQKAQPGDDTDKRDEMIEKLKELQKYADYPSILIETINRVEELQSEIAELEKEITSK